MHNIGGGGGGGEGGGRLGEGGGGLGEGGGGLGDGGGGEGGGNGDSDGGGGEGDGGGGEGGGIGESIATRIKGIHCGGQAPPRREASSERSASDSSRSPSRKSCVWAAQKTVATPRRTMVQTRGARPCL